MRYIEFNFKNFKGIEQISVSLEPAGSGVFTLIGLNESGKTTILEAISAFDLFNDDVTPARVAGGEARANPATFIPKHLKSNYSGTIDLSAIVEFEGTEKENLIRRVENKFQCTIDRQDVPDRISVSRNFSFENSDYKKLERILGVNPDYTVDGEEDQVRDLASNKDMWVFFVGEFVALLPEIVYFPTFLFNQPDAIELNPVSPETPVNRIYREIIQNVAKSLSNPLDVQKHIVERYKGADGRINMGVNLITSNREKFEQVEATLAELSSHLTDTIFDRWARVFGGDFSGREIVLRLGFSGAPDDARISISFAFKDYNVTYSITERSLGFRWFFSFLLFTLYRVSASDHKPTLFLLDEPAANLHSAAQMQLLSSFSRIASGSNQIIYSTHSHYLINPHWLDQAFIVSNSAVDYRDFAGAKKTRDKPVNQVNLQKYRTFVGVNPDRITYFQPVLDKLDVVPSRIDNARSAVIVEGKGDYIYIEYGLRVLLGKETAYAIVPTRGATGMEEIVGLYIGWGLKFAVCLDDDREGVTAAENYRRDWVSISENIHTLADIDAGMRGKSIEGLLADSDLELIKKHFSIETKPSKSQKQLFFSQMLASNVKVDISDSFRNFIEKFDVIFSAKL